MAPKLKMVPWAILGTNLLRVMLLHWSKNVGSVPTCRTDEDDGEDVVDCITSGILSLLGSLLPGVSGTGRYTTRWLPAALMTLSPSVQVRLLCQGGICRLQHRLLLHIKPETSLISGFSTSHRGWKLGKLKCRLLLTLSQRQVDAVDVIIKESLSRCKCP